MSFMNCCYSEQRNSVLLRITSFDNYFFIFISEYLDKTNYNRTSDSFFVNSNIIIANDIEVAMEQKSCLY